MGEWKTIQLKDACAKIGSGATPRGGKEAYKGGATTLIRSQNVYNDGFHRDGLVRIDDRQAAELDNVDIRQGDILLNITGDSVARCCQVADDVLPARVNQHVAIIRPRSDELRAHAIQNMTGTSGRQRVPSECFTKFLLAIPPRAVALKFDDLTTPLMAKIKAAADESRTLATMRAKLLAHLITGD